MNRLYLFTSTFPYGPGENFLETEIPILARSFDGLVLVPTRPVGALGPPRPIPKNARIDTGIGEALLHGRKLDDLGFKVWHGLLEVLRRPKVVVSLRRMRRLWFYLENAAAARRWMHQEGLDRSDEDIILYAYWVGGTTYGLAHPKTRKRPLLIARAHRGDLYEEDDPTRYLPLLGTTIGAIDRLFLVSEHGRDHVVQKWPGHARKLEVARLGVLDPGHTTQASSDGVFRIVSCAHIVPVKRLPLIMQGIKRLGENEPTWSIRWRHLGDGDEREALAEEAAREMPPNVTAEFLGSLPPGGIVRYYADHPVDVFINASSAEGVPVSIMEAQSCGIPAVATAVGGTPEIVNDQNGSLLPADPTPDDIAAALRSVRERGAAPRQASKETWRTMSDATEAYTAFSARLKALAHARLARRRG